MNWFLRFWPKHPHYARIFFRRDLPWRCRCGQWFRGIADSG